MDRYETMTDGELNAEVAKSLKYCMVPNWCGRIEVAMNLVTAAQNRGYWLSLKSPFSPGDADPNWGKNWLAGFTPHGTSGWNGRPDHEGEHANAARAIVLAWLRFDDARREVK